VAPETVPIAAVIVALVPDVTPVATPAVLIVTAVEFEEAHVTVAVRSWVLPSLYVPRAVKACVPPTPTVGFVGDTVIALKVAARTANVEFLPEPETEEEIAAKCSLAR
jgi:hypothetical protein